MQLTNLGHVPHPPPPPSATSQAGLASSTVVSKTPQLQQQEKKETPRDDRLSIADPRQAMQVLEANPKVRPGGQVAVRPGHWLLRHPHLHVQVFVQHLLELHVFKLVALYTI